MKKIIAILLCLVSVFSLAGCADKKADEASNVIDLGGGLGKITLEGDAFGSYKVIETPEEFIFENTNVTVYEDLNSNTPYIIVWRLSTKGDKTLEEIAQEEADLYSGGYYQLFDSNDMVDFGGAYFCNPYEYNGCFYYNDTEIFEDGDDFVELSFLGKTEELQIGDTDVYAYVPVGYTSYMDDDYKAHGTVFCGNYGDDYYFPTIFVGKWDYSYDFLKWYLSDIFAEGFPISEEEHTRLVERANNGEDIMHEFYELLGDTIVYDSYEDEKQSFDYNAGYYWLRGEVKEGTEAWIEIDGEWYVAWLESELNPIPAYATTFLTSLHTK